MVETCIWNKALLIFAQQVWLKILLTLEFLKYTNAADLSFSCFLFFVMTLLACILVGFVNRNKTEKHNQVKNATKRFYKEPIRSWILNKRKPSARKNNNIENKNCDNIQKSLSMVSVFSSEFLIEI